MPEQGDPASQGSGAQADPGSGDPAVQGSGDGAGAPDLVKQVQDAVKAQLGEMKADLSTHAAGLVTQRTKSLLEGDALKTMVADAVAAGLKTQAAEAIQGEPSETEALRESVKALEGSVKSLAQENAEATARGAEQSRVTKIGDVLGNAGIKNELMSSLRSLATHGHASVPKPVLGEDGSLVVDTSAGPQPFEAVMTEYLKLNPHWLAKPGAAGTGPQGDAGGTPPAPVTIDSSSKGRAATDQSYASNPEGTSKAMDDNLAKLKAGAGIAE